MQRWVGGLGKSVEIRWVRLNYTLVTEEGRMVVGEMLDRKDLKAHSVFPTLL